MKNKIFVGGLVAVVIIGGIVLFTQSQRTENATITQPNVSSTPESATAPQMETSEDRSQSNYVIYSQETLAAFANNRRILFFYANWCPTCRPADADFKQNADQLPEGVTVVRVNYNDTETDQEEKELARKYGITYQHTFVQIDENGEQVKKWNGGQLEELIAQIQ
jgi:thioredoxin 1